MATTSAPPKLDPKDALGLDHLLGDEDIMLRGVGDRVLPDSRRKPSAADALIRGERVFRDQGRRASVSASTASSLRMNCLARTRW